MTQNHSDLVANPTATTHWGQYPTWWESLGPPLRPCHEDLEFLRREILSRLAGRHSDPQQVVLLGVTPEIATLPWPDPTEIVAIDKSAMMIRAVWPHSLVPRGKAICGDWQQLPLPDQSCNLVIGDGCFTLLDYPKGYEAVAREAFRVLKPNGLCAIRFFVSPSEQEDPKTVFEQLQANTIGNFHIFKWRLAMALQKNVEVGIKVHQIWQAWHQEIPQPQKLLQNLGWSTHLLDTINIYKTSTSTYTFPNLMQIRQLFAINLIEEICYFPEYELGNRCPTMLFRKNNG